MTEILALSTLRHTWILDLDGTIVKHNGYKSDGYDTLNEEALAFQQAIPSNDMIIIVTAREIDYQQKTEHFLKMQGIRYNHIIFGVPDGERILVNDIKPLGLQTAIAVNVDRNNLSEFFFTIDNNI